MRGGEGSPQSQHHNAFRGCLCPESLSQITHVATGNVGKAHPQDSDTGDVSVPKEDAGFIRHTHNFPCVREDTSPGIWDQDHSDLTPEDSK